jgi:hypothetical protein
MLGTPTRAWDDTTFVTDDIYIAVRWLAYEFAEYAGLELA